MLRRTLRRLAGGDKSSFAAKRQVIHPMPSTPAGPGHLVNVAFTTDAMRQTTAVKFATSASIQNEALDVPLRLEGEASRKELMMGGDKEFEALVDFIRGAKHDDMITGRRFQKAYDALTSSEDVIVWLCMVAMSVLNPGDVRSRLIYRHLEALVQAVATGEMPPRVAFRFYESAIRAPAFRAISARHLETGASSRIAGICAAADAMRALGVTRRPMTPYFELYNRITERSEAMTPWGFPPLFQFEGKVNLEKRLRFFSRRQSSTMRRRSKGPMPTAAIKYRVGRIFWIPPNWRLNSKWVGSNYNRFPGVIAD
jgi:hypothetical protein